MSWRSNDPEDQSICLIEGFLANPDMPLSQYLIYTRTFSNKCILLDLVGVQSGVSSEAQSTSKDVTLSFTP